MIGQLCSKRPFNQRFLQSPEQPVVARQVLGLLVSRKQLIQKFRCQCRDRHVSSFQKVNSQKPAYTRLLTPSPQGFDAGKKVTGRKRHILVDTLGLLLNVVVHPADVQDRDGAPLVLDRRTRRLFPFIEYIFADAGYQGPRVTHAAASTGNWAIEIVKRNELHKFVVLPKRWIVE